jgi:hypothetical protein
MLHKIAQYHNKYLEEFQDSSSQSSSLGYRLIQQYFRQIRSKATIYEEQKYIIALEKTERSARIDRLSINSLFEEINQCVSLECNILAINEMYKKGNKRLGVIQYVFELLLLTLFATHSIHFRCVSALIRKISSMDFESLRRTKT